MNHMKRCLPLLLGALLTLGATAANAFSPKISLGDQHTVALNHDGVVWAWGRNDYGQLGPATNPAIAWLQPKPVKAMDGVIDVAAGFGHSVALRKDGTVWVWGRNSCGLLGNGNMDTYFSTTTPTQVKGLIDVTAIASGAAHIVALKNDGTVWTWGCNSSGELGQGTMDKYVHPYAGQVKGLKDITAISAATRHSAALMKNGTVWDWGMMGNAGSTASGAVTNFYQKPVMAPGLFTATAISAGYGFTLAITKNTAIWGWGANDDGQLGRGFASWYEATPSPVQVLDGVKAVATGTGHGIALLNDGHVWTWGMNYNGTLGTGPIPAMQPTPARVAGIANVMAIAGNGSVTLVADTKGDLWGWGNASGSGQLGPACMTFIPTPTFTGINMY